MQLLLYLAMRNTVVCSLVAGSWLLSRIAGTGTVLDRIRANDSTRVVDNEMKWLINLRKAHALYERLFMQLIPPNNIPLNLLMNLLLKDFWKYPQRSGPRHTVVSDRFKFFSTPII